MSLEASGGGSEVSQLREQITFLEMQLQKFDGVSVQILSLETKLQKQAKEFQNKLMEKDERIAILQMQVAKTPKTPTNSAAFEEEIKALKEEIAKSKEEIASLKSASEDTGILKENLAKALEEIDLLKKSDQTAVLKAELENLKQIQTSDTNEQFEKLLKQKEDMIQHLEIEKNVLLATKSDSANVEKLKIILDQKNNELQMLKNDVSRLEKENLKIRELRIQSYDKIIAEVMPLNEEKKEAVQQMSETEEEYEEEIFVDDDSSEDRKTESTSAASVDSEKKESKTLDDFLDDDEKLFQKKPGQKVPDDGPSQGSTPPGIDEDDDKPPADFIGKIKWYMGIGRKKIPKADMTQDTSFVYDPVLKKWIDKKAKNTGPAKKALPPPAAKVSTPRANDDSGENLSSKNERTEKKSAAASGGPSGPSKFSLGQGAKRPQYALVGQNLGFGGAAQTSSSKPRARPRPVVKPLQPGELPPEPLPVPQFEEKSADTVHTEQKQTTDPIDTSKKQKKVVVKKKRTILRPSKKKPEPMKKIVSSAQGSQTSANPVESARAMSLLRDLEAALRNIRLPAQTGGSPKSGELSVTVAISKMFFILMLFTLLPLIIIKL